MKERKIYLVRHAKPQSPDEQRRYLGQTDTPLSQEGIIQAENLARYLEKYTMGGIFASDLLRASQTAAIIAAKFNLPVKPESRLREINMGEWENLPFEEVRTKFPDEYDKRGRDLAHYRPPGGESFSDLQARALPAFNDIVHSSRGNIVIVAHAGVNRVILASLMSVSLQDIFTIKQGYASICEILFENDNFFLQESISAND